LSPAISFHRQRALHAVRRWLTTLDLLEEYIRGGAGLRYLTAACEILRSTKSSVWTDADTKLYHDFAARVRANWDSTNGMARPDLFFNQGAYANGGAMAMAVFIEDADFSARWFSRPLTERIHFRTLTTPSAA
jgi:hypothetical protein